MTADLAVTCERFEAEAADLALGHVGEPARARLLEHATTCPACQQLLVDLSTVCDRLLDLAPSIEPPVGFEARAVARMAPRPRPRLPVVAAAAAVALLLVVAGIAIGRASDGDSTQVTAGEIVTDDGTRIGTAELERADTSRVVLTMDGPSSWDGTWTCELQVGGRWVEVGQWTADEVTNHVWAAGIDESLAEAGRMRILGASGKVIATADLRRASS